MLFASPDGYAGSSVQAAIASSSRTFSSVWNSVDGYAYSITFNEIVDMGGIDREGDFTRGTQDYHNRDTVEVSIDTLVCYSYSYTVFPPDYCECRTGNQFWVLANMTHSLYAKHCSQTRNIDSSKHPHPQLPS